jgi:hypothetical protein
VLPLMEYSIWNSGLYPWENGARAGCLAKRSSLENGEALVEDARGDGLPLPGNLGILTAELHNRDGEENHQRGRDEEPGANNAVDQHGERQLEAAQVGEGQRGYRVNSCQSSLRVLRAAGRASVARKGSTWSHASSNPFLRSTLWRSRIASE